MTSLGKKYVMAVSGLVLVGFVIGHMIGNLQMFLHPDWINGYAYKLQHMPYGSLWLVRLVLLIAVIAHVVTAVLLVIENKRARPDSYAVRTSVQATFASRTMRYTGLILLAFIVFHILHFTTRHVHPEFRDLYRPLEGVGTMHGAYEILEGTGRNNVHDAYSMVAIGFSPQYWYVSLFYVISMGLLFFHLSHGVSSMFQSVGLRNHVWRMRLDRSALALSILLFVGFASIPVAALLGILPYQDMVQWPQAVGGPMP